MKLFKNIFLITALVVGAAQAEQEIAYLPEDVIAGKFHSLPPLQLNKVNDLCEIIHPTKPYIGDPRNGGYVLWAFSPAKKASSYEIINALHFYSNTYRTLIIYFDEPCDDMSIIKQPDSLRKRALQGLDHLAKTTHIPVIVVHNERVDLYSSLITLTGSFQRNMYPSLINQRSSIHYFADGDNKFFAFGIDRMLGAIVHINNLVN